MLDAGSILPIGAILVGTRDVPGSEGLIGLRRCVLIALGGKSVSTMQSFVFDDELHSLWSHVAIMGGDDNVWDIMPDKMVRRLTFADFVRDVDLLAVRCLRGKPFDADDLQAHILDQARCDYPSFARPGTVLAFVRMMSRRSLAEVRFKQNELICSTFVDRILRLAASREILPDDRPPLVLPGHFARSSAFEDVPMVDRMRRLT